ncbi:MAG TPA: hypothetical protein VHV55_16365 [Pirellulales bacterium]|nr:hypothetical protein [Pirellulales bacterium]
MQHKDKDKAKQVIVEIIRAAGGTFDNKTNLFKAFYHAHLHFAEHQRSFLSTWPIVHMPNGPGIDSFDRLLGEMLAAGVLETRQTGCEPYRSFQFAVKNDHCFAELPTGSAEAIAAGVAAVDGRTAAEVSQESHRRAWHQTANGEEMNIYLDLIPDAEYDRFENDARDVAAAIRKAWAS